MVKYDPSEDPASLSLCRACNAIFELNSYPFWAEAEEKYGFNSTTRPHHASQQSLRDAVGQECWLCRRLPRDRGGDMRFEAFEEGTTYRLRKAGEFRGPKTSMRYLVLTEGSGTSDYNANRGDDQPLQHSDFRVDAIEPWEEVHEEAVRARATDSTGSEATLKLANLWLKTCEENHSCGKPGKAGWYPTRLLDISTDIIRLIHSGSHDLEGPYASLSHCWGRNYFLRLTTTTIETFKAGVPFADFPVTFQHTITTVRALGIRYLWIDCYCIIQGNDKVSQTDWAREVDKMRDVYSHSFINIGAATTDNPFGGLFRARELHRNRTCFVKWQPSLEEPEKIWRLREHDNWTDGYCFGAFQDLQKRTLMRRAWVVQETALSNRMLTFTDEGLMWQCNWTAATEDFPLQMSDCIVDWGTALPFWTMTDVAAATRDPELAQELRMIPGWAADDEMKKSDFTTLIERWYRTLDAYRRARLTFPEKDTFPAIDGIARLLSTRMRDRYQHGVFSRSLVEGLIWSAKAEYEPCHGINIPGIPSWHWASYEGGVDFWGCEYLYAQERESRKHFASLAYMFMADDCTALAGPDAKDFWPDLLCIGKPLAIDRTNSREVFAVVSSSSFPSSFVPKLAGSKGRLSVNLDKDEWLQHLEAQYAFLPILGTHDATKSRFYEREIINLHVQGLVLRKTGHGRYRRVGVGSAANHEQDEMMEVFNRKKPEIIILE